MRAAHPDVVYTVSYTNEAQLLMKQVTETLEEAYAEHIHIDVVARYNLQF